MSEAPPNKEQMMLTGTELNDAAREAFAAVYAGNLVVCTRDEWPSVRRALQEQAGRWINQKQDVRAIIALEEVRRLDREFDYPAP